MDSGIVTALSGAMAQSRRIDMIANNLANADTPGFKGDAISFEETLEAAHREDNRADLPKRSPTESELLSRAGDERRPVLHGNQYTDWSHGSFRQTSNQLDVAIEGNGFLPVKLPSGELAYTRAGNLKLDQDGKMVTADGYQLGTDISVPPESQGVTIAADGTVTVKVPNNATPVEVGKIQLAGFANPAG